MENQQSSVPLVSNIPDNINPQSNSIRILIIFMAVLVLIVVGTVSYILGTRTYQLNKNIKLSNNNHATQQIKLTQTSVTLSNTQVVIKPITISTGIDISKFMQNLPYNLKTGKGHYLLEVTKKLIYDGQTVYANNDL